MDANFFHGQGGEFRIVKRSMRSIQGGIMVLIRSGPSFATENCFKALMENTTSTGVVALDLDIGGRRLIC